jgi:hypothetical protein
MVSEEQIHFTQGTFIKYIESEHFLMDTAQHEQRKKNSKNMCTNESVHMFFTLSQNEPSDHMLPCMHKIKSKKKEK